MNVNTGYTARHLIAQDFTFGVRGAIAPYPACLVVTSGETQLVKLPVII
jgi:hypothetical protein